MRKLEEIENQIKALSREEFKELREWVLERDWEAWDAQIGRDAEAGKLDRALNEARDDYKAGRSREL
jgi:hypothetical protein